jgi:exodeoxyribonuclease V alpha subunit
VVTRELIYTGITRARRQVILVGGIGALKAGVTSPTRRHSGLIARLDRHLPTA